VIAGIDLGGTQVRAAVARADGRITAAARTQTDSLGGPEGSVEWMADTLGRLGQGQKLKSIGIGAPGPIDPHAGVLVNPPNLNGWRRNVPIAQMLTEATGVPVHLENDANLAGLGELHQGAGVKSRNMVYITWSTGIGAGVIIDRRLYSGTHGAAGEFGHMIIDPDGRLCHCGQRGCLETAAAGWAIAARTGRPAVDVFEAAAGGDHEARLLVVRAARHVGLGLVNLTNLFDPDLMVLGGGIVKSWSLVSRTLVDTLRSSPFITRARRPRLVRARLGGRTGLVGAVEWARANI
jgi:glucokinase